MHKQAVVGPYLAGVFTLKPETTFTEQAEEEGREAETLGPGRQLHGTPEEGTK